MDPLDVVQLMDAEEPEALRAVAAAGPVIAQSAAEIASRIRQSGRVFMIGAGTSGRLIVGEISELPPTFGAADGEWRALVCGRSTGGAIASDEDNLDAAPAALAAAGVSARDAVVGIAASGTTPFVLAGIRTAAAANAWTCAMANNADTVLLDTADVSILLDTGPELLTGSTRLKAATAQKLALNRLTTATMVSLGRVEQNHMIDMVVSVDKLRHRAIRIAADLGDVRPELAEKALQSEDWSVRAAVQALRSARE